MAPMSSCALLDVGRAETLHPYLSSLDIQLNIGNRARAHIAMFTEGSFPMQPWIMSLFLLPICSIHVACSAMQSNACSENKTIMLVVFIT